MTSTLPAGFTLLQVTPRLEGGGVERATLDMVAAVTRADGRAIVASVGGGLEAELRASGGELARLPVHRRDPASLWMNVGRLTGLIRRERVSLVHVRSRAPAFSAIAAARSAGVPVVATYHGIYSAKSPLKRWYNRVMTRGDLVIANSNFTSEHIVDEHALPRDRVAVVPEGIDLARFNPEVVSAERVAAVRRSWGVPSYDRRAIFLCPGRLTEWKGQRLAIEAFSRFSGRAGAILLLAGKIESNAYARDLISLSEARGIADAFGIAPPLSDMPAALLAAHRVLAPSLEAESFGRVVVEAGAMGRAVIASALGAHLETVVHGETGWLAAPNDIEAWSHALESGWSTEMAEKARRRVARFYGLDAMVEATFAVYRDLLARRS